jgi:hypothetical protein
LTKGRLVRRLGRQREQRADEEELPRALEQPAEHVVPDLTRRVYGYRLPTIRAALVLLLAGVAGNVAIIVAAGPSSTASPRALVALSQVFGAFIYVGGVWLGGLLAYRSVMRRRG